MKATNPITLEEEKFDLVTQDLQKWQGREV